MKKSFLPLFLVFLFYMDSLFMIWVPENAFNGSYLPVPRFFLIGLLFMSVFFNRNTAIKYAFFFGFLFDMFYTDLLGAYMFFFPLIIYITSKLIKWLHSTIPVFLIIVLFDIALLEIILFGLNVLVKRTFFTFEEFAYVRLLPTLVLNAVFYTVLAIPLRNTFIKIKKIFD